MVGGKSSGGRGGKKIKGEIPRGNPAPRIGSPGIEGRK